MGVQGTAQLSFLSYINHLNRYMIGDEEIMRALVVSFFPISTPATISKSNMRGNSEREHSERSYKVRLIFCSSYLLLTPNV